MQLNKNILSLQNSITIIPARGGAKRLPGKNTLPLEGIPLIIHSIRYAKVNAAFIDRIVVSTDNLEIKKIALEEGVEVIDRPAHLCTDEATTVSALKHVLETVKEEYDNVILLQPTNPLRPQNLLGEAWKKFRAGKYDSLMTVSRSLRKLGKIKNSSFLPFNYTMGQRSQEMEPLYFENGLLYIAKAKLILEDKLLGENNFPFIVDHPFAEVDIDVQEDLDYAEFLLAKEKKKIE